MKGWRSRHRASYNVKVHTIVVLFSIKVRRGYVCVYIKLKGHSEFLHTLNTSLWNTFRINHVMDNNQHVILNLFQDSATILGALWCDGVGLFNVFPLKKVNIDSFKWGLKSMWIETKRKPDRNQTKIYMVTVLMACSGMELWFLLCFCWTVNKKKMLSPNRYIAFASTLSNTLKSINGQQEWRSPFLTQCKTFKQFNRSM